MARPVIGDIAAPIGFENLRATRGEPLDGHQQVLRPGVAAQRIDMRVLKQEQRVGNRSGLALVNLLLLKAKPLRIVDEPELFNVEEHKERGLGARGWGLRKS